MVHGGIASNDLRAKLLREPKLTLSRAEEIYRAAEASDLHSNIMKKEESVRALQKKEDASQEEDDQVNTITGNKKKIVHHEGQPQMVQNCLYCGRQHQRSRFKCPAYGKTCMNCSKLHHFAAVCKSTSMNDSVRSVNNNHVHLNSKDNCHSDVINDDLKLDLDVDRKVDSNDNEFFISNIEQSNKSKEWTSILTIHGHRITFLLDTGAHVNVLSYNLFKRLKNAKLEKSSSNLTTYSGERLNVIGKSTLKFHFG